MLLLTRTRLHLTIILFLWLLINALTFSQILPKGTPYFIDVEKNINNIKSINLSTIGKELIYLPLETKSSCLIQYIFQVEFSDSYIFVHDYDRILQFDRMGKFIRQIGSNGRGPKEYLNIQHFCIDEQKKEIYIISSPQLLSVFDFNGIFKNAYKLSHKVSQVIVKDKNSLMYYVANVPRINNPSWIITNRNGETLGTLKNTIKRINEPGLTVISSPLYSFDKTIHFMEFGIDTLYYFKDNKKMPYAFIHLGDFKLSPDILVTPSMQKNKVWFTDKFWAGSIKENEEFLFIKFFRGFSNGYFCALYNKKTNAVTFVKDEVFVNDLNGVAPFWPKDITTNNLLVDYVDAFDLLKNPVSSSLRGKITETSNPILLILK